MLAYQPDGVRLIPPVSPENHDTGRGTQRSRSVESEAKWYLPPSCSAPSSIESLGSLVWTQPLRYGFMKRKEDAGIGGSVDWR